MKKRLIQARDLMLKFLTFLRTSVITIFFLPLGFGEKEYESLIVISNSKKKYAYNWWINNVGYPIFFSFAIPIFLTQIHDWFGTINFSKSVLEISITGSLTLSGLNILRSTSTMISERLDETNLTDPVKKLWYQIRDDIFIVRNKLDTAVGFLTTVGVISYMLQISQLINGENLIGIYCLVAVFIIIFIYSIAVGRLIFVLNANFLNNEDVVRLLFSKISTTNEENNSLSDQVRKEGL